MFNISATLLLRMPTAHITPSIFKILGNWLQSLTIQTVGNVCYTVLTQNNKSRQQCIICGNSLTTINISFEDLGQKFTLA